MPINMFGPSVDTLIITLHYNISLVQPIATDGVVCLSVGHDHVFSAKMADLIQDTILDMDPVVLMNHVLDGTWIPHVKEHFSGTYWDMPYGQYTQSYLPEGSMWQYGLMLPLLQQFAN